MSNKRYTNEMILKLLNQIEQNRSAGMRVHQACRLAGITDTTYYKWRNEYWIAA
ncbi:MAG: transposase [Pseudomonadota bacterium]